MKFLPTTLAAALALAAAGATFAADTSGAKIALSNNFAGNSWRQAMLKSWDKVTRKLLPRASLPEHRASPPQRTRLLNKRPKSRT